MQKRFRRGKIVGQFIVLDQTRYNISPSVTILGYTFYSEAVPEQIQSVSYGLKDFHRIEDWSVDLHCHAHFTRLSWLNEKVESISHLDPAWKIIILTHHCPCTNEEAIDPKCRGCPISSGFATDSSSEPCWINQNVIIWALGYTHFNCDF